VPAHCAINNLPTSVEPVNEDLADQRIRRQLATHFASRPRHHVEDTSRYAGTFSEVCERQRRKWRLRRRFGHDVQPAASAGPTFRVIIAMGKFHG
jgi:hypothetical protein